VVAVSSESGKFSTDIGEDVIAAALENVERSREAATAQPPAEDPPGEEASALQARLEALEARGRELEAQLEQERERALRALADLDNARKRSQREREEVVRFGMERALKDLLPVIDNLDRALELGERTGKWEGLAEGVRMTRKLLEDTLGRQGLKAFSARGQPFDPHLHEAMGHEVRADLPANTVSTEVLRGYMLHDRLVRPALVMVARPPSPPATPPAGEAPAAGTSAPAVAEGGSSSSESEPPGEEQI